MRALRTALLLTLALAPTLRAQQPQSQSIVLRAARILDGKGGTLADRAIVIRHGRIAEITAPPGGRGDVTYELSGLTVLPGLIDTHVHIGWHFDRDGKTHRREANETPQQIMLYGVENAYITLMSGVTTVQSLGAPEDADLRDWIARGAIPGPRIVTSLRSINESTGSPDSIRQVVRELARAGADVIKIFASASIRDGGAPTMSPEQVQAACGEAKAQGLRSVVHAHGPESARRSAEAGCTTIEHGALLDRQTLEVMGRHGMYFDPNLDLVFRNYFEHKAQFLGVGNYTEEGFAHMERAMPLALNVFKQALTVPGLKVVFGTDGVAGAHGRNYQELVYRMQKGGQQPMKAIVSATSLAAASLGLADRIGAIAAGMEADIIALDGDPLEDPTAVGRVVFVMKGGKVYKNVPARRTATR
ncbi:MAG: amidohydrolase family protein [Gemmatimonadetes bacterium]|nr:amidohydrolase family protein [Gemmatimonadota bacterium]